MPEPPLIPDDPQEREQSTDSGEWSYEGFGITGPEPKLDWQPKPVPGDSTGLDDAQAAPRGADLLIGRSTREVMQRIGEGDPLEVETKCHARIAERAMLMDTERLTWRAMAYIALVAVRDEYRGDPPLDAFLTKQIDEAIDSLLDEDWAAETSRQPVEVDDPRYRMIAEQAGLEPALARRVTLAFNTEPLRVRRVLFGALIQNRPLAEVARENALAMPEAKAMVKTALEKIFGASDGRSTP